MAQWDEMRVAGENEVLAFDQVKLAANLELKNTIELEKPAVKQSHMPFFLEDLSGAGRSVTVPQIQAIRGSYLLQRSNVLLFGSNNIVTADGEWNCENRDGRVICIGYMQKSFFSKLFPGDHPEILDIHTTPSIGTADLARNSAVRWIDDPIFLGTPVEPPTWGRWVSSVLPRASHFLKHGAGRKFLCHVERPWERTTLNFLGIADERIIPHEPGKTYLCRDVMMVENTGKMLSLSSNEREIMGEIVARYAGPTKFGKKIFVCRATATKKIPNYRPLLNESDIISLMEENGFSILDPDLISFPEQISAFNNADVVVFVGGSAIYNTAFCRPGTRVVTIESSTTFAPTHMEYFSALDMHYGVILGQEDPEDTRQNHRRWTVDAHRVWDIVRPLSERN